MNPYEAEASKIPISDLYSDLPLYGRYHPTPDDFKPVTEHCNSYTPESLKYWEEILEKCDATRHVCLNPFGGRDVFALGSVIIKSGHLRMEDSVIGSESTRDYSIADANEVAAIKLVPETISTPQVLFAGKIKGHDILVQSRIPGVGLNVAWPYLSALQKASFKTQAHDVLRRLRTVRAPSIVQTPTYIVPDPNPVVNRDMQPDEIDILFRNCNTQASESCDSINLCLMHNDLQPSNIIVEDDKIVGIIDWEHTGWFRWNDVHLVHSRFRTPRRENFVRANLSEAELDDLVYWGDLYMLES